MNSQNLKQNLSLENSLVNSLESIALKETALACIINTEGDNVQAIVDNFVNLSTEEVLDLHERIYRKLRIPLEEQILLQSKLEAILDLLKDRHTFKNLNETIIRKTDHEVLVIIQCGFEIYNIL